MLSYASMAMVTIQRASIIPLIYMHITKFLLLRSINHRAKMPDKFASSIVFELFNFCLILCPNLSSLARIFKSFHACTREVWVANSKVPIIHFTLYSPNKSPHNWELKCCRHSQQVLSRTTFSLLGKCRISYHATCQCLSLSWF